MIDWSTMDVETEMRLTRLHDAADRGDLKDVRKFLAEGDDPNLFDVLSRTPLHYAIANGNLELGEILLQAGCDVNAHEEQRIGNAPLREVAKECSYHVAAWLIAHGADPSIPGWMNLTALDKAEGRNDPEGKRVYELLKSAVRTSSPGS